MEDAPCPGQAQRVVTPQNIAAVEAVVKENCRVTLNDIAACLKISHGSSHHIVHDVLQFHKVSARWVPRQLTPELRESDVLMLVKNFFGALNKKVMVSLQESLLGTKPGFTSTNRKRRERARNGAIPHRQNQRSFEQNHQQGKLC